MPTPFVGLPTTATGGCAFSVDLDHPHCGKPATFHVAVDSPGWGTVSLATCDDHLPIARTSGTVLAEHPHQQECETADCWAGVV